MDTSTETLVDILDVIDSQRTSAWHRSFIRSCADEAFKSHQIFEEAPGVFRCQRPGTIHYSFRVAFLPGGLIVVYGDIGDMMLRCGGEDWLTGAIRHDYVSDYVMEKRIPARGPMEFMEGDAYAELMRIGKGVPARDVSDPDPEDDDQWEEAPDPKLAIEIANRWLSNRDEFDDGISWTNAYYDATADFEGPRCMDYTSNDLWCYYALCWFVSTKQRSITCPQQAS